MDALERTLERHSVMLAELERRLTNLEDERKEMREMFGFINQSIGELKAEVREIKAIERTMEIKRQKMDSMTWAILFLILTQIVIAAFEFMKR